MLKSQIHPRQRDLLRKHLRGTWIAGIIRLIVVASVFVSERKSFKWLFLRINRNNERAAFKMSQYQTHLAFVYKREILFSEGNNRIVC